MKLLKFIALVLTLSCMLSSCGIIEFRSIDEKPNVGNETTENNSQIPDMPNLPDVTPNNNTVIDNKNDNQTDNEKDNSSESEPVAETEPEIKTEDGKKVISFLAVGDNIIHENVYTDAKNRSADGNYDFLPMYDGIKSIVENADIAFVNQETPIAGEKYGYSGYPNFNSPEEAGENLVELGFDIVNMANNHMLDKKTAGYADTITFWNNQDIFMIGGYSSEEDYNTPRVFEYDGVKIAFLSYTYGTNGMILDTSTSMIIPLFDENTIRKQVAAAKESADLVFASAHWGIEDSFIPSAEQVKYAKLFAECGVDVVIGHHPHVVQPIEWIENDDGTRTLVIYSLGNVLSTMLYGKNMVGTMVSFDIVVDGEDIYIDSPVAIPTVTHYDESRLALQIYLMENYTEDLAKAHGCRTYSSNFSLDTVKKYITDTISEEFLPEFLK